MRPKVRSTLIYISRVRYLKKKNLAFVSSKKYPAFHTVKKKSLLSVLLSVGKK